MRGIACIAAAVLLAGCASALTLVTPASAKFIGTMYYEPRVMLEMCKSEIERGEAGFCTGYVIATQQQMAIAGKVCLTPGTMYEDMVSVVVRRIEYVLLQLPNSQLDTAIALPPGTSWRPDLLAGLHSSAGAAKE